MRKIVFLQLFIICVNIKLTNFIKSGYFVVSFNNGNNFTGAVIEKTKNFLKSEYINKEILFKTRLFLSYALADMKIWFDIITWEKQPVRLKLSEFKNMLLIFIVESDIIFSVIF